MAPVACSMVPNAPGLALGEPAGEADGGAADGGAEAPDADPEQAATTMRIVASAAGRARYDMPPGRPHPPHGSRNRKWVWNRA